jgi:hypothetical protein
MKTLSKLCILILLVGITSCRDTKKEEAETEAIVNEIEAIEAEAAQTVDEIDAEAEALEEAMKELDSI